MLNLTLYLQRDMILQTYISNNDKIVLIKPRLAKTSTSQKQAGGFCEECGKQLQDKRNRFCSIKCKVTTTYILLVDLNMLLSR